MVTGMQVDVSKNSVYCQVPKYVAYTRVSFVYYVTGPYLVAGPLINSEINQ